jgi:hypothetical protein
MHVVLLGRLYRNGAKSFTRGICFTLLLQHFKRNKNLQSDLAKPRYFPIADLPLSMYCLRIIQQQHIINWRANMLT